MAELHIRIPDDLQRSLVARAAYAERPFDDFIIQLLDDESDESQVDRFIADATDELWARIDAKEAEQAAKRG